MFIRKLSKKISDKREVIKKTLNGKVVYNVKYISVYEISIYLFKWLVNTKTVTHENISPLCFDRQSVAEAYAKNTYKCDSSYHGGRHSYSSDEYRELYITSAEKFSNYGKLVLYLPGERYEYINRQVKFEFYDTAKYGDTAIDCDRLHIEFLYNIDKYIRKIEDAINTLDFSPVVVSSYDYEIQEMIPYDKLTASSEELQQLNELLRQYREDQKQYREFLEKLMAK